MTRLVTNKNWQRSVDWENKRKLEYANGHYFSNPSSSIDPRAAERSTKQKIKQTNETTMDQPMMATDDPPAFSREKFETRFW